MHLGARQRRTPTRRVAGNFIGAALYLMSGALPSAECHAAAAFKIVLVQSDASSLYQEAATAIANELLARIPDMAPFDTTLVNDLVAKYPDAQPLPPADLYIAIGSHAAQQLAERRSTTPILTTLVSRAVAERIDTQRRANNDTGAYYGLYLDQPTDRQLALIVAALPDVKHIAVLLGDQKSPLTSELKATAQRLNLGVNISYVRPNDNIVDLAKDLIRQNDVLLTVADPNIYTRQSVQSILLLTYHHRLPTLGYSASFVKAGALLGLYTSPEQNARQTAEIAQQITNRQRPARIIKPKYFTIAVNQRVAQSIGVQIPPTDTLERQLRAYEEAQN